jgi:outer membrane lipopolysaccharide assembly protein LptE/RlpB
MNMFTVRVAPVIAALALTIPLSGCGYSLAGRGSFLPTYIRTIAVPLFSNLTPIADVDRILTERVRNEFISRGRYRVIPEETGADAVLTGAITNIRLDPAALTQQQQASRYVLVVTAKVEFTDLKEKKVLWQNPSIQFREEFTVATSTDASAFLGQNKDALQRVATEFARAIVSAILEAF